MELTIALAGDRYAGVGLAADILAQAATVSGYRVRRCEAHDLPNSAAVSLAMLALSLSEPSSAGYRGADLLIAGSRQQAESLRWLLRPEARVQYVENQPVGCRVGEREMSQPVNHVSWWPLTERLAIVAAMTELAPAAMRGAFAKHLPQRGQDPAWAAFQAAHQRWARP